MTHRKPGFLSAFLIVAGSLHALDWIQGKGVSDLGNSYRLACHGTVLYNLGGDGALYRSTDTAKTWVDVSKRFPTTVQSARYSTPRILIRGQEVIGVGLVPKSIVRSKDEGTTWINFDVPSAVFPNGATEMQLVGDSTLIARADSSWFRSEDDGKNWTEIPFNKLVPDKGDSAPAISAVGSILFAFDHRSNSLGSRLFVSRDVGRSWSLVDSINSAWQNSNYDLNFSRARFFGKSLVVTHNSSYEARVSEDSGQTWRTVHEPVKFRGTVFFPATASGDTLFFANSTGLFWSLDTGRTLARLSNGFQNPTINDSICRIGPVWVAATDGGVYLSRDHGKTWAKSNAGVTSLSGEFVPRQGGVAYWEKLVDLFQTSDSGANWHAQGTSINSELGYVGVVAYGDGVIGNIDDSRAVSAYARYKTTWTPANSKTPIYLNTPAGADYWIYNTFVIGKRIYQSNEYQHYVSGLGTVSSTYATDDTGKSWGIPKGLENSKLTWGLDLDGTQIAGDMYATYRSDDSGASWNVAGRFKFDEQGFYAYKVTASKGILYAIDGSAPTKSFQTGLILSRDTGKTWTRMSLPMLNAASQSIATDSSGALLIVMDGNVFITTNQGDSWAKVFDKEAQGYAFHVAVSQGQLHVAAKNGLWRTAWAEAKASRITPRAKGFDRPFQASLSRSGNLRIVFELPSVQVVRVEAFDLKGQRIAGLLQERRMEAGRQELSFPIQQGTGPSIVRLTTPEGCRTALVAATR